MTTSLKELVKTTLEQVERSVEPSSDETALSELKHSVVLSVAELDVRRERDESFGGDGEPDVNTGASKRDQR